MGKAPIRPTRSQLSDLETICSAGPERLDKLAKALAEPDALTIVPTKLRAVIRGTLGELHQDSLFRVLLALASFGRGAGLSGYEIVDSLDRGLSETAWEQEKMALWEQCKSHIARLLDSMAMILTAKALDLSFDYVEYCLGSRILTDIRPVFDDQRTVIVGAIISQVLRLDYASHSGRRSMSVALDMDDINKLRDACDLALRKVEVLD